jgi:Zn-dependent M32 family carboxypeptidase
MADAGIVPGFDRLMLEFDDARLKSLLVDLDEEAAAKQINSPQDLLEEWISRFIRREQDKQSPTITETLREGGLDETAQTEMLQRLLEQHRARHGISEPTDG